MKLSKQLALYSKITADDFRKVIEKKFNDMFPDWTDDALLCKPTEALRFDEAVREEIGDKIPDEVINRTLINIRKAAYSFHHRTKV